MPVKIRLARFGSKKRPIYRMVVSDIRAPRDGDYIERVGWFDPRSKKDDSLLVNLERVDHWLGHGAQPTPKAASLIKRARRSATTEEA